MNGLLVQSLGSPALTAARDRSIGRLPPIRDRVSEARSSTWSLARSVLDVTGKRVFVDTARDHQRPKHLAGSAMLDIKVIHLVRDPRGNAASIVKHTGVGVARAARQWRHYNAEADRVRRLFPAGSWMLVRYEDLRRSAGDPRPHRPVRRRGARAGPTAPRSTDRHVIGNSMRLQSVEAISEDTTWRATLGPADLRVIANVTRSASRRLGYGLPASGSDRPRLEERRRSDGHRSRARDGERDEDPDGLAVFERERRRSRSRSRPVASTSTTGSIPGGAAYIQIAASTVANARNPTIPVSVSTDR